MAAIPFLRVIPSQANYFMIQLDTSITPRELSILLLKRYNILIKDCDSKHGLEHQRYVRIAVRSREDNDRLIAALHEIALQLK
jgi:histidinol-phosphate/aromatic aminotransferase/cobyric acid decarboxylase-like protein